MTIRQVAAVDLGAESGRVVLARYDGQRIALEEVQRFANRPVLVQGHRYWNILGLWQATLDGLRLARTVAGTLDSVGVDTWGVDYGLLDRQGILLAAPYHYRDTRTTGVMATLRRGHEEAIYAETGIQFLPFNTLYQLAAHRQQQRSLLHLAHRFLLLPDLFHFWLSGEQVSEQTNASTTQLWSPRQQQWSLDLFDLIGVPASIAPPVITPGALIGPVTGEVAQAVGGTVQVVAPATHDTASAVAAIPVTTTQGWAYISSGTWSLVGVELAAPLLTSAALHANFTNEAGIFGTTRLLRNVMGLWLLQECLRTWEQTTGERYTYDSVGDLATAAPPLSVWIDPDDPRFLAPHAMPEAIQAAVMAQQLPPLTSHGAIVRCILESLVLRYRQVLATTATLTQTPIQVIHIVGGGAKNVVLNQWLADATGLPVLAGPYEATALGNALLQLVALGELRSLREVRGLAAQTCTPILFPPDMQARPRWDEAYGRFQAITRSEHAS